MSSKQAVSPLESSSHQKSSAPDAKQVLSDAQASDREDVQNELERLREILYGRQARLVNQRLAELETRLDQLQTEMQRRDDQLRQELLRLITALERDKASRQDVGQMLMELGQRLTSLTRPDNKK